MEAKDTVMNDRQIKMEYLGSDYHPTFSLSLEVKHGIERVAQAQAELSFILGYEQALKDIEVASIERKLSIT